MDELGEALTDRVGLFGYVREGILPQSQGSVAEVRRDQDDLPERKSLLEEARARTVRERDLSSTTQNAHYAAASLGQSPYVSLQGVGIVTLRRGGWGC